MFNVDFNLCFGFNMVVFIKCDVNGVYVFNIEIVDIKNFVGYINNMNVKISGYYNECIDRYVSLNIGNIYGFWVNVSI